MITVSHLQRADTWDNSAVLEAFCGKQLRDGRLALVLGAGASVGFGLPGWDDLTTRIMEKVGIPVTADLSAEERAELAWKKCAEDDLRFAAIVRDCLYRDYNFDLSTMQATTLLPAVGALAMASRRGALSQLVTFNFDEVLESYLRYFGFTVESIPRAPSWDSRADVRILHPHGCLPRTGPVEQPIVFTLASYNRVLGNAQAAWHRILLNVFTQNTCVFVGLSGKDDNLTTLLYTANDQHPARVEGYPYWGVRFARQDDTRKQIWETRGIYQREIGDFEEIPEVLFRICQRAAEWSAS